MRLSDATVARLSPEVERPGYDRAAQKSGIVHLGIGAFHRAHQAWYTDNAMNAGDRDWAITGVSLRSGDVAEQMNPQDGLYTVTEKSPAGDRTRLIGSVQKVLVAKGEAHSVVEALAAAETHIVSFTVTEKGYLRAAGGGLDVDQADGLSIYSLLADAFTRRRARNLPGLTLLSCDNLPANGVTLDTLMREYLSARRLDLLSWYQDQCTCPSTMIDRIVPATTEADRDDLERRIGVRDEAAVFTEPFTQWVIEDKFAGPRPRWEVAGAQFTDDVHAWEKAKLRMLNGAHSALAYIGLKAGYSYVHQAMADPAIAPRIDQLMRMEAATSLEPLAGFDANAYADALTERFLNPALHHKLIQIAMDGSQKIPQRWLETLAAQQQAGRECPAILQGLTAWLLHIRGDNGRVDDPLAEQLSTLWASQNGVEVFKTLFVNKEVFNHAWSPREGDIAFIKEQLNIIE